MLLLLLRAHSSGRGIAVASVAEGVYYFASSAQQLPLN